MSRQLPIGIQTFREIREGDCYYVDKTGFALRLIEQGKYYFLSRPRRFGKSLFLDTLVELISGNEPLFRGLHVHEHWDWQRRYPVIRLSFADGVLQSRAELNEKIGELLTDNEIYLGVRGSHKSLSGRFHGLIREAHAKSGQRVVVLVDEYDKPILENLSDSDTARAMRDGLRNLYSERMEGQVSHCASWLLGLMRCPLRYRTSFKCSVFSRSASLCRRFACTPKASFPWEYASLSAWQKKTSSAATPLSV